MNTRRIGIVVLLAAAALGVSAAITPTPAVADAGCDLYADPGGNDGDPGTAAEPKRSPIALLAALSPAQTGCLTDGATFVLGAGEAITATHGAPGQPKTLRPATPGARATITTASGFWMKPSTHDLVLRDLDIRRSGSGGGSLMLVDGDRITLDGLDLTYSANICLDVGADPRAGEDDPATDFVLRRSRIHDCGSAYGPPHSPNDSGVHGIYLQFLRDGADLDDHSVVLEDNLIYRNHNRGLQLYPDVDDALVQFNVIYGNGANVNLGSEGTIASQRNVVTHNIIAEATLDGLSPGGFVGDTSEVLGNYPQVAAPGNHVDENCIANQDHPGALYSGTGFTHVNNVENQDPMFVDPAHDNFHLAPGSPCAGWGARAFTGPSPTCQGRSVTLTGTTGTRGNDVILGTAGADTIRGRGGRDRICGGRGRDVIAGGRGPDVIDGGRGRDACNGGRGRDRVTNCEARSGP